MVEIAHGHWDAAASTMEEAIYESEPGEWTGDCLEMRDFCIAMDRVKCQGLTGLDRRAGADRRSDVFENLQAVGLKISG